MIVLILELLGSASIGALSSGLVFVNHIESLKRRFVNLQLEEDLEEIYDNPHPTEVHSIEDTFAIGQWWIMRDGNHAKITSINGNTSYPITAIHYNRKINPTRKIGEDTKTPNGRSMTDRESSTDLISLCEDEKGRKIGDIVIVNDEVRKITSFEYNGHFWNIILDNKMVIPVQRLESNDGVKYIGDNVDLILHRILIDKNDGVVTDSEFARIASALNKTIKVKHEFNIAKEQHELFDETDS